MTIHPLFDSTVDESFVERTLQSSQMAVAVCPLRDASAKVIGVVQAVRKQRSFTRSEEQLLQLLCYLLSLSLEYEALVGNHALVELWDVSGSTR